MKEKLKLEKRFCTIERITSAKVKSLNVFWVKKSSRGHFEQKRFKINDTSQCITRKKAGERTNFKDIEDYLGIFLWELKIF